MEKTISIPWCGIWGELTLQLWSIRYEQHELESTIAVLKVIN